jgi:hypothetical protein
VRAFFLSELLLSTIRPPSAGAAAAAGAVLGSGALGAGEPPALALGTDAHS